MLHILKHTAFFLIMFAALSSCSKTNKPKSAGTYVDVDLSENRSLGGNEDSDYSSISIPRASSNSSWKNSDFSLKDVPENISVSSQISRARSFRLYSGSGSKEINRNPVITDSSILVLDHKNNVYCYNAGDPSKLNWKINLKPSNNEFIGGGISSNGKYAAVTYGNKDVVLLNIASGKIMWRYNLSNISRAAPIIYQGSVFALTVDNKLYSVDLDSGLLKWTQESASEQFGIIGNASPEAAEGLIITPYSSGQLGAIDSSSGDIKWNAILGTDERQAYLNDISMTPVISDHNVYLANHSGALFSISISDGSINWISQSVAGNNSIWIAGDHIYSINKKQQLFSINKNTGAKKWSVNLAGKDSKAAKFSGPLMANGELYIGASNGKLMVLSAKNGSILREITIEKNIYSPPIAVGNVIYLLSNSGTLSVIN